MGEERGEGFSFGFGFKIWLIGLRAAGRAGGHWVLLLLLLHLAGCKNETPSDTTSRDFVVPAMPGR